MSKRIKCRSLLCFRFILAQTANDNGGFCAKCFKRKNSSTSETERTESPYESQLKIPVSELTDRQKRSQLQGAIRFGNESRMEELLSGDTAFLDKSPSQYDTWLGEAISQNCTTGVLDKLLRAGCDPNSRARSPDQTCPLEVAVSNDRIDAIEWLLQNGADPNLGRPLVGAISFRKPPEIQRQILTVLIGAGADVNKTFDLYGDVNKRFTVLDWAVLYQISSSVIEQLKAGGAKHKLAPEQIEALQRELKPRRIVQ